MVLCDPVFYRSALVPEVHGKTSRQSRGGRTNVVHVTTMGCFVLRPILSPR